VRGGVATARRNNLMNKVRQSGSDPDSLLADELTYQKDLGARITKALRPDQSS
jgi:hypothetical protein